MPGTFHRRLDLRSAICMAGVALALACAIRPAAAAATSIEVLDENAQPGAAYSREHQPQDWLVRSVDAWMSGVPDGTPLWAVSIPGTHDSGARHGGIAVETQSWSIHDQLRAGVRYLDVRVRRSGNGFAIHHGPFYQHLSFSDVMEAVAGFLQAHPSETVLMRIKEEHEAASGSESFASIWERELSDHRDAVYLDDGSGTVPPLGSVRGKVVFLRDSAEIPARYGIPYASQTIQDAYKVWFLAHRKNDAGGVSLPVKKDLVKEYITLAAERSGGDTLVLNHLSGAVAMAPGDVARRVNGEAFAYLAGFDMPRRLGVLVMDFPGERLLYRIIKSNFRMAGTCPARTFRVQSAHSWAEFRLPADRPVGQTIEIPGGAYNRYVFPKCNRVRWDDLSFLCTPEGVWERSVGSWDADARCHGSPGDSPYVVTGAH